VSESPPAYLHLRPDDPLPALPVQSPFKTVIVAELPCTSDWRSDVATWLVREGCLYCVCWGVDCSTWEGDADWANTYVSESMGEAEWLHVMTTMHPGQPLAEAFWFHGQCASDPDQDLGAGLIVHVASHPDPEGMIRTYKQAQTYAS